MRQDQVRRALCAFVLPAVLVAGCSHIPKVPDDRAVLEPPDEYVVGPGDHLAVKLFYTAELNEEVVVRPDGRISLQLVGDVPVAGHTPAQIAQDLTTRYDQHLSKPDVAVIVRGFASQKAYVGGEVKAPTMVLIDGRTTVADAVFAAGGSLDTAELSSVVLLRRGPERREAYRVDLSDALEAQAPLPVLRPYDVVYVPKSFIAKVGMYVDLYINRILPRNAAFNVIYEIDKVDPTAGLGAITGVP